MKLFEDIGQFLLESEQMGKRAIVAVLGPTASGKTALSLRIARAFNGEIISADSRQIYRHMDIGTDKIPDQKQEGVRHHLINIIDPREEFTLADYKRSAIKAINDIHIRKKLPILCGGTGLYLNTIIENYQIPQVAPQYDLRQQLAQYYEEHGPLALHKLLRDRDPETADRIHPHNVRYVIRALEINEVGKQQKVDRKGEQLFNVFSVGIDWPRDELYERINRRVDDQVERGLLNEVKTLLMKGYDEKLPSMSSLGYLELIAFLKGMKTYEEALEEIKKNTRNYAKRQITWFRRYANVHWISSQELDDVLNQS
jgi:tRNA dimethylallyltransferase